jgi:hypothetical protein
MSVTISSRTVSGPSLSTLINAVIVPIKRLFPSTPGASTPGGPPPVYAVTEQWTDEEVEFIHQGKFENATFVEVMWSTGKKNERVYEPAMVLGHTRDGCVRVLPLMKTDQITDSNKGKYNYYVQLVKVENGRGKLKFVIYVGGEEELISPESITEHPNFDPLEYTLIEPDQDTNGSSEDCDICRDKEKSCLILKCMHRICAECVSHQPLRLCPFCRGEITGVWCTNMSPEESARLTQKVIKKNKTGNPYMTRSFNPGE